MGVSLGQSASGPGGGGDPGSGPGPIQPTEPTQPTQPTEPTQPTQPTQPTEPTPDPGLPNSTDTQPALPPDAIQLTATVNNTRIGSVGADFTGFSFEKSELVSRIFSSGSTQVIAVFKALGQGVMRIGGSAVESIVWDPSATRGQQTGKISSFDVDAFAGFLNQINATKINWRIIYGIRLRGNTIDLAAQEAVYAASKLGAGLYAFSLGNEPNYTTFGTYYAGGVYYDNVFRVQWQTLRNAILQRMPDAKFVGPDATDGNVTSYTIPFAADPKTGGDGLESLAQHYYRINDGGRTLDKSTLINMLLTVPDTSLVSLLSKVKTAAGSRKFRITETNSVTSGGLDGVSNTYASALWALDHAFTIAKGGASGIHFHGGDAAFYTPFTFQSATFKATQPIYYGILFFAMMGSGDLFDLTFDAGRQNISAYAIKVGSNFKIMFVNKEVSQGFEVTLNLATVSGMTARHLTGSTLTSANNVQIQGQTYPLGLNVTANDPYKVGFSPDASIPEKGRWKVRVPPLTAVLVEVS